MNKYYFAFAVKNRLLAAATLLALIAPWIFLGAQPVVAARQQESETIRSGTSKDKKSESLISSTIVISQVYGGAGCGTAGCSTYKNDYIELFNRGNSPVSLNGWSVQYAAATGTSWQVTNLTNVTLQPGQYYLVGQGAGANGINNIPTPDATGTVAMSATAAKIALVNTTTALSGACPVGGQIVDFVGYGTTPNCNEGGANAPAPSTTNAVFRAGNGCTETDNNGADFTAAGAAPRNTASTLNPCGGGGSTNPSGAGAASPNSVAPGGTTLLTVTVTPGTNPASNGLSVTGDLTLIGGSATQTFFDNGSNGDVTPGDNIFSYSATVAIATSAGSKNLPAQISDAQTRTGSATITLTVTSPPVTGQTLPLLQNWSNTGLITANDVWSGVPGIIGYRGDDLTTGTGTDPQTILADGGATPVTVLANQTNPNTLTSGGIAEFDSLANPVVAFQGSATSDAPHLVINLDTTGKSNITVSYNLRDIDGSTDDSIQPVALQYRIGGSGAYTNLPAAFVPDASSGPDESSQVTPVNVALPAAVNNQSLIQLRIITTNANGSDEWIGIDDIVIVADGTIPLTASGSANPNTIVQGNTTLLTVTVNPATNPTSTGITVSGDLTSIGGLNAQTFFDDGSNGDVTPGDNIFSYLATVPVNNPTGAKSLPITVGDAQARMYNFNIGVTVIVPGGGSPHTPDEHLVMGNPTGATMDVNNPTNYLLPKNQYVMSYHRDRAIPNWVSWHLDSTWIGGAQRQNDFRPDPDLPAGWYQVSQTSYSGSGFDRGHHTPSADRTDTIPDNSATFFMTNMMPQAPGNNQGPWENLESYSRTVVGQGNELYIVAGGYGSGGTGDNGFSTTVDAGRVAVPSYTWKVILVLPVGESDVSRVDANTRVFAVIMPNNTAIRPDAWQKYLATVDQVEALTGYDFFSNVPANIQDTIESRLDTISNTAPQSVAGGTYTNLDVSNTPQVTLTGNVVVTGSLDLGPSIIHTGNFKLTVEPNASVARISGYVDGTVEKQFADAAAPDFVFPVGSLHGYSPVTADLTALGTNPSSLAVKPVEAVHPNVPVPNQALGRYWTLTETGDLTANITFQYLQRDVPPNLNENTLALQRYETSFMTVSATIDTTANTATATGISQFSDWTLFAAPTAANVTVSGIVSNGKSGIPRAIVSVTDGQGNIRSVRTSSFGFFRLDGLPAGGTYVFNVTAKGYSFVPQIVTLNEDLTDFEIMAF